MDIKNDDRASTVNENDLSADKSSTISTNRASVADIRCKHYTSIFDVQPERWDDISPELTGLKHNVLKAFEHSGINDLVCHYLFFEDSNNEPVAKANLYQVSMDFTTIDKNISDVAKKTIHAWHPGFLNLSMIECGLFAMNGDGIAISEKGHAPTVISQTVDHMQAIADSQDLDILVMRDVPLEKFDVYNRVLSEKGFYPVAGFTNSVIDIRWSDVDEFLAELKSKDRYKFKSAMRAQDELGIEVKITQDYESLAPKMAELWKNVNASATEYSREQLDERFFLDSAQLAGENTEIIAFFDNGNLVAFMWNLIGEQDYHMADWGVDYNYPHYKTANFYRIASIISLQRAIELGKARMQLGITNYVPKRLLTARFQPLVYFIKHRENDVFSRTVARMMSTAIEQPEPLDYYQPNSSWSRKNMTADEYKERIWELQSEFKENDAFRHIEYGFEIDILKLGGMYPFYPVGLERITDLNLNTNPAVGSEIANINNEDGFQHAYNHSTVNTASFFSGVSNSEQKLVSTLAAHLKQESVVLLNSGYLVHAAALKSLVNEDSVLFLDEQCGPPIWDAVQLAGASEVKIYPHCDYATLETMLNEYSSSPCLIITEAVFSLFGDQADVSALLDVKSKSQARVYIDESHSYAILGEYGSGMSSTYGRGQVDVVAGSFASTLGEDAGFISSSSRVIEHIKHTSSPLLFSSSITDDCAQRLDGKIKQFFPKSINENRDMRDEREVDNNNMDIMFNLTELLKTGLEAQGFSVICYGYPIVTVILGDYMLALSVQQRLLDSNINVMSLGPPVLPETMSGLRIALNHVTSMRDIERLLEEFKGISIQIHGS